MCSCPKPMTHAQCRCQALEVYAKQCEAQGSAVWWRGPANCSEYDVPTHHYVTEAEAEMIYKLNTMK